MKYKYSDINEVFHARESWLNVFVISFITKPLTFLVVNFTKITPNIISVVSLLLGIISAFLYFTGNEIWGAGIYFVSYVFDAIDGKVARLKGTGKVYGSWVDVFVDRVNLTIISTSIAWNYFMGSGNEIILLLNGLFLGLAFIGWESRYNIDLYKIKTGIDSNIEKPVQSGYAKWTLKNGLDISPISLVEIFLFYLIVSPLIHIETEALCIAIFFLIVRIIRQQKFWYDVSNKKE